MLRCRTLEEYSILISRIYSKILEGISLEQAIDFTVQDCIHDNILRDFLIKHRSEVVGMLLEEFDMEEYIKMERRDSYEDGNANIVYTSFTRCTKKIFLLKAASTCWMRMLIL